MEFLHKVLLGNFYQLLVCCNQLVDRNPVFVPNLVAADTDSSSLVSGIDDFLLRSSQVALGKVGTRFDKGKNKKLVP